MPIPWGQHLDLARCAASIGELDLGAGALAMAGALHFLQRGLLIDSWTQEELLLSNQLLKTAIQSTTETRPCAQRAKNGI
tara:strand:- start:144 stop:383 length:240 start_codon:yes stop_codon:yes gene_type:complete